MNRELTEWKQERKAFYLLYDILCCAKAGSFDDSARLLWGNIMHLNKETIVFRANVCVFFLFLKSVSPIQIL